MARAVLPLAETPLDPEGHQARCDEESGTRFGYGREAAAGQSHVLARVELVPHRLGTALHVVEADLARVAEIREVPEGDAVYDHVASRFCV